MDQGQEEKALHTLARLHAQANVEDEFVQHEAEEIRQSVALEREVEAKSYLELFKTKTTFRRLLIGVSLQASGQLTGVSAIQYFSPTIFKQIGLSLLMLSYEGRKTLLTRI